MRDKFSDATVLSFIKDENVKKSMKMGKQNDKKFIRYKQEIGINEFRNIRAFRRFAHKVKYTGRKKALNRNEVFKSIYAYTQRQGERFAITCEDVYYAIPHTVRNLVRKAVDSRYSPRQYLGDEEQKRVNQIRAELRDRFGENNGIAITAENLQAYIDEKIEYERTVNFASNVANEIAIKYIGGFGNASIKTLLINMGYLSRHKYKKQNRPSKGINESVRKLIEEIEEEDPDNTKENNSEQKRIEAGKRIRKIIRSQRKETPLMVIPKEENER